MATLGALLWDFNPRSPHRERPCGNGFSGDDLAISIHAPLTGSDDWQAETSKSSAISIHAPLTGSDDWRQVRRIRWNISIHAPLTGSDLRNLSIFNRIPNFNPRSPHRERRLSVTIHVHNKVFQSTLPSQGATGLETGEYIVKQISIHAPLTGSDGHEVQMVWRRSYFNPRSPHRERQHESQSRKKNRDISIHAPLTGSDLQPERKLEHGKISIHAPLTGSDGLA